jgi:hypothetical protein
MGAFFIQPFHISSNQKDPLRVKQRKTYDRYDQSNVISDKKTHSPNQNRAAICIIYTLSLLSLSLFFSFLLLFFSCATFYFAATPTTTLLFNNTKFASKYCTRTIPLHHFDSKKCKLTR